MKRIFLQGQFFRFLSIGFMSVGLAIPASAQDTPLIDQALSALEVRDYAAASEQFSQAFDAGNADGAFYLGRMLELGMGGTPNLKAAVGLYLAGSAKGSAPSKNRLGVLHIQGKGVLQDYAQGATLVCDAAELGDVNGAYNCAQLTLAGRGVAQDETRAYELFQVAAEQGHFGAMNEYANGLIEGKFVSQDIDRAVQLFQQTASVGNPVGLYSLGQAFAVGLGVDQDLVRAHQYFNLSAALGHPEGAGARDAVEKEMAPEAVLEAQRLAKAWRPTQETPSKKNEDE